ncbi:unnamed protein product [Adineta steineri]|uniref:LRAT domain-containing protein n=1 Tax=Adineta steineri TaxID=433720 RepID=A0A818RST9_9BILA|nr:unnamed protein product [Adineta steineri]
MSLLLVTDDADDDISNHSIINQQEYFYKQLKELEYDLSSSSSLSTTTSSSSSSSSSVTSISIVESSSSIIVKSNKHYRQHRRRRRCRPQQCLVQHLLTYMLTLLILTNHLHWSVIFLSLSSIKIMSTHASTISTTTLTSSNQLTIKRPLLTPSTTTRPLLKQDEQQCLPIDGSEIDRICSKKCRARKTPFEKFDNISRPLLNTNYLPFCSNFLHQTIMKEDFFDKATENECRERLNQIIIFDKQAQEASKSFATYMEAIDCASIENRYSIITADCEKAYRTWACSVTIPYFYRNQQIPPCQTICDEVERVCPTFRPSDREPLFAGQPLFFCDGGIVTNSDYGHRPHCFDSCHVLHGSLQRPSASTSSSLSNNSSSPTSPLLKLVEDIVTTPPCFEIEPLSPSLSQQITSSLIFVDESISNNRNFIMAEVAKIEKTKENEDVLAQAKPGDMIEFIRSGYSHWAIYAGNGFVIHRWGDNDGIGKSVGFWGNFLTFSGTQFDKATILQSNVTDVLNLGGKVRINNYLDNKYQIR